MSINAPTDYKAIADETLDALKDLLSQMPHESYNVNIEFWPSYLQAKSRYDQLVRRFARADVLERTL